jgi:hypothetical protein
VLNCPTNDVWIDPWLAHLRSLGVDYRCEHQVQAIHYDDGQISGVGDVAGGNAFVESATSMSPRCRSSSCGRCSAMTSSRQSRDWRACTGYAPGG